MHCGNETKDDNSNKEYKGKRWMHIRASTHNRFEIFTRQNAFSKFSLCIFRGISFAVAKEKLRAHKFLVYFYSLQTRALNKWKYRVELARFSRKLIDFSRLLYSKMREWYTKNDTIILCSKLRVWLSFIENKENVCITEIKCNNLCFVNRGMDDYSWR